MSNDNPYRSPTTSDSDEASRSRTNSPSLFWTGMFAGAFVGATYGAAAGALCGLAAGVFSLNTVTNGDIVGQIVMLVVAGAISGTIWGAMLGMTVGTLTGTMATVGSDRLFRRLPTLTAILSVTISTSVTVIILGTWSRQRNADSSELQSMVPLLAAIALTAITSGLGGLTLGRGLTRTQSKPATSDDPQLH